MSQQIFDFLNENKDCMFTLELLSIQFDMQTTNLSRIMLRSRMYLDWEMIKEDRGPSKIFYFIANDINK